MEILAEKKIVQNSHSLFIKVYDKCLTVMVAMSMADFVEFIPLGVDYERMGLHKLLTTIFNTDHVGLKIFTNDKEYIEWHTGNIGFLSNIDYLEGTWSKTAAIDLSGNSFEKSLELAMNYITTKSEDYEKNTPIGKARIAAAILNRY